VNDIGLYVT